MLITDWKGNRAVSLWRLTFETGTVHRYLSPSHGYLFLYLWAFFIIYKYLQGPSKAHTLRKYIYIYWFQNVFLHCPTPRIHCFLSSHWLSFRFLSFMAFLIPTIQFLFGLPSSFVCFGIHFNAIFGNLPSAIL
jgi:hypothetical protein